MEENQYLMWMKRKQVLKSHIQAPFFEAYNNNNNSNSNSSSSSSWEERAFAEDAARILGGCIWPPRSYSCNFCKREFRSAQALGGHMNVHRRDRARLKQSLIIPHHHNDNDNNDESSSSLNHHHHKNSNDCKSLGTSTHHNQQFSAAAEDSSSHQKVIDICNSCLVNPNYSSSNSISGTAITTRKISNQEDQIISQHDDNMSHIWGQKMTVSPDDDSEQKGGLVVNASRRPNDYDDCVVETSLSVGLKNSVFGQELPNDYSCVVVEEDTSSYKRPKTDSSMSSNSSLHSVFIKPCSNFHHQSSAEFVLGMEDLDLELRLGKPQKA